MIFISWVLIKLIFSGVQTWNSIFYLNFRLIPQNNIFLEVIWTLVPCLIFFIIFIPLTKIISFIGYYGNINKNLLNLYTLDLELSSVENVKDFLQKKPISIKCVGNQWFWTYEIPSDLDVYPSDLDSIYLRGYNFDSKNNINCIDLSSDVFNNLWNYKLRLISTDKCLILPYRQFVEFNITSNDVIHNWALPYAGVKIDATPGRLSFFKTYFNNYGFYYGQCSELCGMDHGFMPITLKISK